MRYQQLARSTSGAFVSTVLLLASQAPPIFAAPSTDPAAIAQAYGEMYVFMLNVAAGNDGQMRDPAFDQKLIQVLADEMLTAYPNMSDDQQQSFAGPPDLRDDVWQNWPALPIATRRVIQQQLAAVVQQRLAGVPCNVYIALARAHLVPRGQYFRANRQRFLQCRNEEAQLAGASNTGQQTAQPTADEQHQEFVRQWNAQLEHHVFIMNLIGTAFGGGRQCITYGYQPCV